MKIDLRKEKQTPVTNQEAIAIIQARDGGDREQRGSGAKWEQTTESGTEL